MPVKISPFLLSLSLCAGIVAEAPAQKRVAPRRSSVTASTRADNSQVAPAAVRGALAKTIAALEANRLTEAETAARQAVAIAPRAADAHNLLGVVLDRLGRTSEALKEFDTAINLDTAFVSARNNRARIYAQQGRTKEAAAEFQEVLRRDPQHVQAQYNLGVLYGETGDFARAADYLRAARRALPNDLPLAFAYLQTAYRANRNLEADALADTLERQAGGDVRPLFTLATVYGQSGQYERAAKLYKEIDRRQPRTYEVLYNLGIALYNLNRPTEAALALAEAADINPAPAETHFRLGLLASEAANHPNAIEEFKHATERAPSRAEYHYMLGREYFRVGYWSGAIESYSRATELDPKQAAYLTGRANAFYRKGERSAAAADFEAAYKLDSKIANIEYLVGYTERAAGNFERAREVLTHLIAREPRHLDALASLGYVAIEQGRLDDADTTLREALRLDPKNAPVLYDYARLAVKRRDYPEAVKRLEAVLALQPTHTQSYYQLFIAYSRLKDRTKAQTALSEFKRLEALEKQVREERNRDENARTQQMLGRRSAQ